MKGPASEFGYQLVVELVRARCDAANRVHQLLRIEVVAEQVVTKRNRDALVALEHAEMTEEVSVGVAGDVFKKLWGWRNVQRATSAQIRTIVASSLR